MDNQDFDLMKGALDKEMPKLDDLDVLQVLLKKAAFAQSVKQFLEKSL